MSKYFVFSHLDLDGVVAYMVLKWYFKKSIPVKFTTANKFAEDFTLWSKENIDKYDKIFILDLDVSAHRELVDNKKIVIYDHHSINNEEYSQSPGKVTVCSSAAKLVFQIFSRSPNIDFTLAQKRLVALADDYDSYTLSVPESYELNIILFESQNKPFNFIDDFENGFNGFNEQQKNIITLHKNKLRRVLNELPGIYANKIKIQGKDRNVVATFADSCINEVAEFLIKTHKADLAIVANMKSNHVSLRKSNGTNPDLDVSIVAQKICDGGGRAETAGGVITEKFQNFTKLLQPL